jgi:hypothetical protein
MDTTDGRTVGAGLGDADAEALGEECVGAAAVVCDPPDPPVPPPDPFAAEVAVAVVSFPPAADADGLMEVVTVVVACDDESEAGDEQPAAANARIRAGAVDAPIRSGRRRCTVVSLASWPTALRKPGPRRDSSAAAEEMDVETIPGHTIDG